MKRIISVFLALICIIGFANPIFAVPGEDTVDIAVLPAISPDDIELEAQGAILMGLENGEILFSKDADKRLYPASTTKILTGLLALENGNLEEIVTIGNEANLCAYDSSKAGIDIKEEISLENLIYGLMLPSGNDAAYAIAVHIGRKVKKDPSLSINEALEVFIDLMNSRTRELGAKNSHFGNPDGYHDNEHYTTARDLALITQEAMKHDIFRKIVSTRMFTVPDWSSLHDPEAIEKETRYWKNSNALIQPNDNFYYPDATGVKTGYTSQAMHCLVTSASRDGMELIAVVLGSSKHGKWNDSMKLLDYGFDNYELYEPFSQGQQVDILNIKNNPEPDWVRVIVDRAPVHIVPKGQLSSISEEIQWNAEVIQGKKDDIDQLSLPAPVSQFQKVGTMIIQLDDKILDEIDLITSKAVEVKEAKKSKSPVKMENGIDTSYTALWYNYSLWHKVGIGAGGFTILIIVICLSSARRRRKRYAFRRR